MVKRIFFLSNSIAPAANAGGGSVVIYRHLKRFCQEGYKIGVIFLGNSFPENFERNTEFEYYLVSKETWYPPFRRKTPILSELRITLLFKKLKSKISFDPARDTMLGILGEVSNLLLVRINQRAGLPFFLFFHDDTIFNRYRLQNLLSRRQIGFILKMCSHVFAVSRPLAALLHDAGTSHASALFPIPEAYPEGLPSGGADVRWNGLQALTAGMIEPIHYSLIEKIGAGIKKAGGRFWCISGSKTANTELSVLPGITHLPRFKALKQLFDFVAGIDILVVFYSFDVKHEPRMLTSFPSKFLEFCQLGRPVLIIAPVISSIGQWAMEHGWLGYCPSDVPDDIAASLQSYNDPAYRERAREQSARFAEKDFNPAVIHRQLALLMNLTK